jgi:hypothetical protein
VVLQTLDHRLECSLRFYDLFGLGFALGELPKLGDAGELVATLNTSLECQF